MTSSKLSDLGESGLLQLLTSGWAKKSARVQVGSGDDCAVLRVGSEALLFKTDAVLEGVHFTTTTPPQLIGRKALARALSDIAAMGGVPLAAVVTLGLPADSSTRRLREIYRGMEKLAQATGVSLVGGETTRAQQLFLNVSLLGEMDGVAPVLRSTAKADDLIFVTGQLGSTQVRKHLHFQPRLREGRWLAQHRFATSMMDLSDGLGADLPRLGKASRLGFDVDPASIPRARGASVEEAMSDGEDYELLFTVTPREGEHLKKKWPFPTPVHCIGTMRKGGTSALAHGFDHLKQR